MTLRPVVRALTVPVLGLALSTIAAHPVVAEGDTHATVNINQATAAELQHLPRVGAKLAERIIQQRTQHGPFKRVEDLMEVKGVGEKMFASLRPYVTVSGPTTLATKVSSAGSRGGKAKTPKTKSATSRGSGR